jgi:ATP-dependent Lon protease
MSDLFEHETQDSISIPESLPVLPLRDIVVFPFMIVPLFVSRDITISAVDHALATDRLVFLTAQKREDIDNPEIDDIYKVGCIGMIMRMRKLVDGRIKILVQGMHRARIKNVVRESPFLSVATEKVEDMATEDQAVRVEAIMRTVKENMEKVINLGKQISPDILLVMGSIEDPGRLADLVATNLMSGIEAAQAVLETVDPLERLHMVNEVLDKEVKVLTMQAKIQNQAREEMSKSQRDYYLREQLRAIKAELGENDNNAKELEELRTKIEQAGMPKEARTEADKQLNRLTMMNSESSEASVIRTYLDWLVEIPWSKKTDDSVDIKRAREILDEDHYDLEKIKERILEFLGVRKLKGTHKGPILCFVGPPGVGKTSLGKSIARAMSRNFVRMSLGGVRDEAEMRGHRRTYVGAMPGKIIQGLKQAGTRNPVFMLDEIDKLGSDFRGDPSSALLEVLDPEQNHSFVDHYINLSYDLRDVMFIATANVLDTIPPPLRDRMEIIQLSGYSSDEKLHIAKRYLVPKQIEENGLLPNQIRIQDSALKYIIHHYTRESGLRNLERTIGAICRKLALEIAEGKREKRDITPRTVSAFLGPEVFVDTEEEHEDQIGVAAGLAWTPVGGEILYIEARLMPGRGNLTLTGQLGDVMKESAQAAWSYMRSKADLYGISLDTFENSMVHIHVPAGAIPKDGPSAGVTMATVLFSVLTGRKVRHDVAMTGEVTLTGKVLPIGGLKMKLLAALRAGIKTVVVPARNRKDYMEIPPHIRRHLNAVFVEKIDQVLATTIAEGEAIVKPAKRPEKAKATAGKKKATAQTAPKKASSKKPANKKTATKKPASQKAAPRATTGAKKRGK